MDDIEILKYITSFILIPIIGVVTLYCYSYRKDKINYIDNILSSIYFYLKFGIKHEDFINESLENEKYEKNIPCFISYKSISFRMICYVRFSIDKERRIIKNIKITGFNIPWEYIHGINDNKKLSKLKEEIGQDIIYKLNPVLRKSSLSYDQLLPYEDYNTY